MKYLLLLALFNFGCATAYMRDRNCHDRNVATVKKDIDGVNLIIGAEYNGSTILITSINQSKNEFRLVTSESFFVGKNGVSSKLFTGKIADRSNRSPDELSLPGTTLSSVIGITDHVTWENGWVNAPLCGRLISPLGKIDTSECKNLGLKLTVVVNNKKKILDIPLNFTESVKKECVGYDLNTGEKLK